LRIAIYKFKQLCWNLGQNRIQVKLMWIPSHVELVENELVDERARRMALESTNFDRQIVSSDFQSLAKPALLNAWLAKWDSTDTGRFTHFSRCDTSAQRKRELVHCVKGFIWTLLCSIASW
jgi:hypothetical protein